MKKLTKWLEQEAKKHKTKTEPKRIAAAKKSFINKFGTSHAWLCVTLQKIEAEDEENIFITKHPDGGKDCVVRMIYEERKP